MSIDTMPVFRESQFFADATDDYDDDYLEGYYVHDDVDYRRGESDDGSDHDLSEGEEGEPEPELHEGYDSSSDDEELHWMRDDVELHWNMG